VYATGADHAVPFQWSKAPLLSPAQMSSSALPQMSIITGNQALLFFQVWPS
jgi:hypothetical protein